MYDYKGIPVQALVNEILRLWRSIGRRRLTSIYDTWSLSL